jgi:hypothetical protein
MNGCAVLYTYSRNGTISSSNCSRPAAIFSNDSRSDVKLRASLQLSPHWVTRSKMAGGIVMCSVSTSLLSS